MHPKGTPGYSSASPPPDTALVASTLALNVCSGTSPAGVLYHENLVVTGSASVTDASSSFAEPTGFIFDTGASTTFHSGTNSAGQFIALPNDLTQDSGAEVKDNAQLLVTGSSLLPWGGRPTS